MGDLEFYNNKDDNNDDDFDIDILMWYPFWFATYEKVYKSRDRRYYFTEERTKQQ